MHDKTLLEIATKHLVSRETMSQLERYVAEIVKWNTKINLIRFNGEQELWARHICDGARLLPYINDSKSIFDIGSGGGIPGLVLAILKPESTFTLIESDQRKSVFLRHIAMQLGLNNVTVETNRIESYHASSPDAIIGRALAPLARLFTLLHHYHDSPVTLYFLKGEQYQKEINEALRDWDFGYSVEDTALPVITIHHFQARHG